MSNNPTIPVTGSVSEVRLIRILTTEGETLWWDNNNRTWVDNIKRATKFGSGWASQHDVMYKQLVEGNPDDKIEFASMYVYRGNHLRW